MKTTKLSLFCVLVLLLPLLVSAQEDRASSTIILDEQGVKNLQIETVVADMTTFEETVFAIGRIEEIPASRSVVSTRIAGRVIELDAFEGDTVSKGQRIAKIESRQLGDPPPTVDLFAPQGGLVVSSHVRLGQPVEPSAELMDIVDRSQVWAVAQIPELEAAQVQIGTRARIHVPALGDRWLSARLARFGVEADRRAGTVEGIFVLDNPEGRLRPGMRAEFSIILCQRENVLAIPREAVQGDPARRVVMVKDFELPHAFIKSPVVLGAQNDRHVEVLSGLFPGDEVVTRGSYGLNFTGGGAGMSLKEALDAAHGHEHNEDGTEMTPEQRAAKQRERALKNNPEVQNTEASPLNLPLMIYAGVLTLAVLFLGQMVWNRKRGIREATDA